MYEKLLVGVCVDFCHFSLPSSVRRNTLWCVQTSLRQDPALVDPAVSCSTANAGSESPATLLMLPYQPKGQGIRFCRVNPHLK